jgi:phi13 family phage major tail protein|nr:MAG TPA: tail tube protein [Caudoviricetes sp.]
MAVTTGFSKPYVATYQESEQNVSYTGGMKLGRGVELSIEVESADDNIFYADNVAAETETGTMTSATGTCTIDGLEDEVAKFVLGIPEPTSETINESPVNVYNYGDDMNPPYLGFMAIQRTMLNGVTKYRPVLLTKTKFNIPGDDWATQEDQIDWQTQELSLSILRDDSANRNWKRVFAAQDTESAAEEIIKGFFGVSK